MRIRKQNCSGLYNEVCHVIHWAEQYFGSFMPLYVPNVIYDKA